MHSKKAQTWSFNQKSDAADRLQEKVAEIQDQLKKQDPFELAARTGTEFFRTGKGKGEFRLTLWGEPVRVSYPDFGGKYVLGDKPLITLNQGLLAYYFFISDGTPLEKRWIAFTELPDGRFYTQAFQSYTGEVLARAFRDNLQAFQQAAQKLGGVPAELGDAAYQFTALPRVPVLIVVWLGDEDFPSRYQVLFDGSAAHYLTTDGCAIVGSTLTRRLVRAAAPPEDHTRNPHEQ